MNIYDLETCEVIEFDNQIIGGAKADVNGKADAKSGKANAGISSVAFGKNNYTTANSSARVYPSSSTAYYAGSAVSRTGRKYSIDYDWGYDIFN
ncbi:MAG: hypothetical protein MJK14_13220 [Rivularia sp. ALOHA_DT_140]|nr:hypothetical protein [Rivularia sp. ALOHA_DT_140]